jgi:hypothetical protein
MQMISVVFYRCKFQPCMHVPPCLHAHHPCPHLMWCLCRCMQAPRLLQQADLGDYLMCDAVQLCGIIHYARPLTNQNPDTRQGRKNKSQADLSKIGTNIERKETTPSRDRVSRRCICKSKDVTHVRHST